MCGICGFIPADPTQPVEPGLLQRMTSALAHRGPDGDGLYCSRGVGLGVCRLAIVDLETGDQPLASEDGGVIVVCNGEIYNFVELRREVEAAGHRLQSGSDAEVIVHLYEELGPDCVHRLRGMFALAVWDRGRRRLMLARDRLGIKPLHYALGAFGLLFGSEQKAILSAGMVERRVDLHALEDLFSFGFVTGPRTMFRSIRRLPPAHLLLYEAGRATLRRYWDHASLPRRLPGDPSSAEGWAEAVRAALEESVRLHLRGDVEMGAFLSPGIDSSSVASLMSRQVRQPVRVFSLGFEQSDVDELARSRTLDQYAGSNLLAERVTSTSADFELMPRALLATEDPYCGTLATVGLRLSEAAARRVKVVLAGEGSDEVFGGYPWFQTDRLLAPLGWLPPWLRQLPLRSPLVRRRFPAAGRLLQAGRRLDWKRYQHLVGPAGGGGLLPMLSGEVRQQLAQERCEEAPLPPGFESWSRFERLQHLELTTRLPDAITWLIDRHGMANSLEVRVPFLDHELVELAARIPDRFKLRGLQEKYVLRRAVEDLLPPEIAWRRKRGLMGPTTAWLRGPLPEFAATALSPAALRQTGYFDPAVVASLLERHRSGRERRGAVLAGILSVQLWDELLLHGFRADG